MSDIISKIFELENDIKLLEFQTEDKIPVYLMGKYFLLRDTVMCRMMKLATSGNDRKINSDAFKFVAQAAKHNILNHRIFDNKEVVLYAVNRPTKVDGRFFNRYTDYFAEVLHDKAVTIEETAMDWTWPNPRTNNIVYYDGLNAISNTIRSCLLSKRDEEVVTSMIMYFNDRLEAKCGFRLTEEECNKAIATISKTINAMRCRTNWLDSKLADSTKLLIMTGANYPHYYPLRIALIKRGIKIADLQHGFITKTNLMYNYAPLLATSDLILNSSADYFLTYGKWWNTQINIPSKKISIGNPYRDYSIKNIKRDAKQRILLIGCEIDTEKYIELGESLKERLNNYDIVFRPHPGEWNRAVAIINERNSKVVLDDIKEIYQSLAVSSMVISEVSTVLFEAIGIVPDIVVLNTEYSRSYLPEHPFYKCDTVEDILSLVFNSKRDRKYDSDEFWDSNWKKNFMTFTHNAIG